MLSVLSLETDEKRVVVLIRTLGDVPAAVRVRTGCVANVLVADYSVR